MYVSDEEMIDLIMDIDEDDWRFFLPRISDEYNIIFNNKNWSSSFRENKNFKYIVNELRRMRLLRS
jgi:hypothetical protein